MIPRFMQLMTTSITVVLAAGVLAAAPQTGAIEQFRIADRYAKVRLISESVSGKRVATETEIRSLLVAGMKDPDDFVRSEAVGMVANILTLSSMPVVPPGFEWATTQRGIAEALWPELDAAADDPESRVRSEALRGIAGPFAMGYPTVVLPSQIANRLAAKFESDPSSGIRSLAVGAFRLAHQSEDPAVRRIGLQVILKALEDTDPWIVQSAAHSAAESTLPEALPLLVKQLKNPSSVARMDAGQVITAYGEAARRYLPELEAALAVETDDITRKTIAGTISVIR